MASGCMESSSNCVNKSYGLWASSEMAGAMPEAGIKALGPSMSSSSPAQPDNEPLDSSESYLPVEGPEEYLVDVPSSPFPNGAPASLPNTLDPMGIIRAEGLAFRRLKAKKTPW